MNELQIDVDEHTSGHNAVRVATVQSHHALKSRTRTFFTDSLNIAELCYFSSFPSKLVKP